MLTGIAHEVGQDAAHPSLVGEHRLRRELRIEVDHEILVDVSEANGVQYELAEVHRFELDLVYAGIGSRQLEQFRDEALEVIDFSPEERDRFADALWEISRSGLHDFCRRSQRR